MLIGQLQGGVHALTTEFKILFFKSKGCFIVFLFVRMSRRGHINCSEPKRNYVTRYKLALLGQVAGGGGDILSHLLLVCISSIIELKKKKTSCKGK